MVVEGRHLDHDRALEAAEHLEGELGAIVPAVLLAADHVGPVEAIEVGEVGAALVDHRGDAVGHLAEERGITVRHEAAPALLQAANRGPLSVRGRTSAAGAAPAPRDRVGWRVLDQGELDQLVVDLEGHAPAHVVADVPGEVRGRLDQGDDSIPDPDVGGQGIAALHGQARVGYRSHPVAVLADAERHGVQTGGDAGGVQAVGDSPDTAVAVGVHLRGGLVVAVVQATAEVDLGEADLPAEVDPAVDGLLGRRAKQVRAVGQFGVHGPGPAIGGVRHARRLPNHALQGCPQPAEWPRGHARGGPREAEPAVGCCPEVFLRSGQFLDVGLQVQGNAGRREGLIRPGSQRGGQVDEAQLVHVAGHRLDREQQVPRRGLHSDHGLRPTSAEGQREAACRQAHGASPDLTAADPGCGASRPGSAAEMIRAGGRVDEVPVTAIVADDVPKGIRLQEDGHDTLAGWDKRRDVHSR